MKGRRISSSTGHPCVSLLDLPETMMHALTFDESELDDDNDPEAQSTDNTETIEGECPEYEDDNTLDTIPKRRQQMSGDEF